MFGWGSSSEKAAPVFPDMDSPKTDEELKKVGEKGIQESLDFIRNSKWESAGSGSFFFCCGRFADPTTFVCHRGTSLGVLTIRLIAQPVKSTKIFKVFVEGCDIAMSMASGEVDVTAEDLFDYLAHNDGEQKFEPSTLAWDTLHTVGDELSVVYSSFTTPFPVTTREFPFIRLAKKLDDKTYILVGKGINHPTPVRSGRIRGKLTIGSWLIEALEGKKCRVTRIMHTDPKGSIPTFLLNFTVNKTGEQINLVKAAVEDWVANGKPKSAWKPPK